LVKKIKKVLARGLLLTTTPFVFITKEVSNLINYIENKEKRTFYDFFINNSSITEFYLYSTYLIFSNNIDKHHIEETLFVKCIHNNTNDYWNKFEQKKEAITNPTIKVFGLHRAAVNTMDEEYRQNLLNLYANFFDKNTLSMIKSILYKF